MGAVNDFPSGMLVNEQPDFASYHDEAEPQAKVIAASAYREALLRAMFQPKAENFTHLPFAKTFGDVQFRPGEVSLWIGENGSGKSMLLSHCELGWMAQGHRVVEASFEMKPIRQLQRKARQFCRGPEPSEQGVHDMLNWLDGRMWFYDQQGTVRQDQVFKVARYAADRLKAGHIVIDSLMKCVRGEDDFNAQKDFVDGLCSIARDTNAHIHLVHHVRKPGGAESSDRPPSKYDAKGSGAITDQVDNVFAVWRNRRKERAEEREREGKELTDSQRELLGTPDVLLICDKQRNGEWEGKIGLWYHRGAMQYCSDSYRRPTDFAGGSLL